MKSIIQSKKECFLCGRTVGLQRHHVFGGPNRHLSEEDGMTVWLCPDCHLYGRNAVHNNIVVNLAVKEHAQRVWEKTYGSREDFIRRYGKNYIQGDIT